LDARKRSDNERKFGNWDALPDGGRRYWYDMEGRLGWLARYVKEFNAKEQTVRFYQEIYNEAGQLVEIHENILKIRDIKKFEVYLWNPLQLKRSPQNYRPICGTI
jgi:hypothetical protein